ncbi:peptidoglycan binding domain-containing protein [Streptomyces sp. NBC_01351]|uniref:peptidoglycan binding domain-containing protein n=1 Tax=Streptomyces sp. NBC_01351 TaxID=2903833 RepID=UPI002E333F52|nr:peptidoglycan binding domain-containing protein [Streptomyces sp. NBC_01351]
MTSNPSTPDSDGPKTETTLTTRIRINIPGSRPIPPVVVRKAMGTDNGSAEARPEAAQQTPDPAPRRTQGAPQAPGGAAPGLAQRPKPQPTRIEAEQEPAAEPAETASNWFAPRKGSAPQAPAPAPQPAQRPALLPSRPTGASAPGSVPPPAAVPPAAPGMPGGGFAQRPMAPAGPGPELRHGHGAGPMQGGPMQGGPTPGGPMQGAPMPGGPMQGAPMPGGSMPGAPMPGGSMPGAPMPGGPVPGGAPMPGAQVPPGFAPTGTAGPAGPTAGPNFGSGPVGGPVGGPRVGGPGVGGPLGGPGVGGPFDGPGAGEAPRWPGPGLDTPPPASDPAAPRLAPAQPKPRAAQGKPAPAKKKRRSKVVPFGGAVIALFGVAYGAGLLLNHSDVPKGTTVLGVDISGSRDEAVSKLQTAFGSRAAAPLQFSVGGKQVELKPEKAGLSLDSQTTVRNAVGSDYNPMTVIGSLFGNERVAEPVMPVDEEKLQVALQELAGTSGTATEATITFDTGKAVAVPGKPGAALDVDASAAIVAKAFRDLVESGEPAVPELPVTTKAPTIDQAEIDRAMKEFAEPAMSANAVVKVGGKSIAFGAKSLPKILSMQPVDGHLVEKFDLDALKATYGNTFDGVLITRGTGDKTAVTPQDVAGALTKALRGKTTAERTVVIDTNVG